MKYFPVFIVTVVLLAATAFEAQAQRAKADIKGIEVETIPTPQFSYDGDTKKLPSAREWVEIELELEVESEDRNAQFIDDIEVTYYVVMNDEKATMLVNRVTYVNVPVKEETFTNVFVSPPTIVKLTGGEASSSSVVQGVAIEVRFQGALIAEDATTSASSRWWQNKASTQGMLLKKSETPFAFLWWDRYAEEKKER